MNLKPSINSDSPSVSKSAQIRFSLSLILLASSSLATSTATAQIYRLPPPDTTVSNYFGAAVAIDGTTALIGASSDRKCGENAGAAFIYELQNGAEWRQTARLEPDDCREGLFFGKSVSVSGNLAAVVAYVPFFSGAASNTVYIFERAADSTWFQTAKLRQPPGHVEGAFAASISLDGHRLLVTTTGDVSSGEYDGAAYIYEKSGESWPLTTRLTGGLGPIAGIFGTSGSLQGDRAVIAASTYLSLRPGTVYVFDRDPATNTWSETAALRGIFDFFISVDVDGDRIVVGESKAGNGKMGRARIFELDAAGKWIPRTTLKPSASYSQGGFGSTVALSGNHALVVGFDEQLRMNFNIDRVVYLFERNPDTGDWFQKHIIDVGDVAFASSIDLDGDVAVIGHAGDQIVGNAYIVLVH